MINGMVADYLEIKVVRASEFVVLAQCTRYIPTSALIFYCFNEMCSANMNSQEKRKKAQHNCEHYWDMLCEDCVVVSGIAVANPFELHSDSNHQIQILADPIYVINCFAVWKIIKEIVNERIVMTPPSWKSRTCL